MPRAEGHELCCVILLQRAWKFIINYVSGMGWKEKWEHILPLPAAFESELFRWSNHWKRQEAMPDESVAHIIASHADGIFFPNKRELLKILAVLPIGSTEAARSFSCLRRLHTWLRSRMTTDRLSDLSVIAMHGNTMVALESGDRQHLPSIYGTPSKKDDGTITFWAVNIVEDISG